MGIKFKQIDNLQNTFDSVSGNLQQEITSNSDAVSGIASGEYTFEGDKHFSNNVNFSGAQGILVNSDNIYTPNGIFADSIKIGYPLSDPRNSTPSPLGALQVSGGQIYLEDQLNIGNNSSINIENGSISGGTGNFYQLTGERLFLNSGDFLQGLSISGSPVSTGSFSEYNSSGIAFFESIDNGGGVLSSVAGFVFDQSNSRLGINQPNPSEALEISGNIILQNNDRIKWKDTDGFGNPTIFVNASDELRLANNSNGDGGDIVFANKSGSQPSVRFKADGKVGIGTNNPQGILDISSTERALIMPRMNDSQMNNISSPVNGMMIYNTTSGKFAGYAAGSWTALH